MKYKIMQHCFGRKDSGGPVVAFERLLAESKQSYGQIRQTEPANGISIALIRRFVAEIKSFQPDLIHVRGLGNEGFHAVLAARLARVPNILVSIHGTHRDLSQQGNILRHWIVTYVLETLTLIMASHLATVCHFAANRNFLRRFRHKLVGVVPNGVEVPDSITVSKSNLRSQLGLNEGRSLAICVSRITVEKGYLVLAEALALIDSELSSFDLVVVGGGDADDCIKEKFKGLNHITVDFVGHQKDVGQYLAASDFFIFPSLHENLSNALIEAMAYGLPVIATDVGGNTEVVNQGGGVLVPVANARRLADEILEFLRNSDLVKKYSKEAQDNIRHNYVLQKTVAGWECMYSKILDEAT